MDQQIPPNLNEIIARRAHSDGQFACAHALLELARASFHLASEIKDIRVILEEAAEREKERVERKATG